MKQTELFEKERKQPITFTTEKTLWESFQTACSNQDLPASFVLRQLMKEYIQKKAQLEIRYQK